MASAALAGLAAALLCASSAPARASCAAALRWDGRSYVGIARPAAVGLGDALGTGTLPDCGDSLVVRGGRTSPSPTAPPTPVRVVGVPGVDPTLAVGVADQPHSLYLAAGRFAQLADHPLHEALYGRPDRPNERRDAGCGATVALRGTAAGGAGPLLPLDVTGADPRGRPFVGRRIGVLVDVATRMNGLDRQGLPYVGPDQRLQVTAWVCKRRGVASAKLVAREVRPG